MYQWRSHILSVLYILLNALYKAEQLWFSIQMQSDMNIMFFNAFILQYLTTHTPESLHMHEMQKLYTFSYKCLRIHGVQRELCQKRKKHAQS